MAITPPFSCLNIMGTLSQGAPGKCPTVGLLGLVEHEPGKKVALFFSVGPSAFRSLSPAT